MKVETRQTAIDLQGGPNYWLVTNECIYNTCTKFYDFWHKLHKATNEMVCTLQLYQLLFASHANRRYKALYFLCIIAT